MTNIGPSSVTLLLPGTPTEGCPDPAVTEDLPARGGGLQGPPPPPAGGRGRGAAGEHWAAEQQVTRGSDRSPGPAEEQVQAGARYQYQVKLTRYRQAALSGSEEEPSVQTEEMLIKETFSIINKYLLLLFSKSTVRYPGINTVWGNNHLPGKVWKVIQLPVIKTITRNVSFNFPYSKYSLFPFECEVLRSYNV